MIYALCNLDSLDSPVHNPVYETNTRNMANLTSNYHNELKTNGLAEDLQEGEVQEVLGHLNSCVTQAEKASLAKCLKESEIMQAVKNLPNGKSPGIDGIPHELWKKMAAHYENDKKAGNASFTVVKVLTKVYNDIELHGVDPTTEFSVGWLCPYTRKEREQK